MAESGATPPGLLVGTAMKMLQFATRHPERAVPLLWLDLFLLVLTVYGFLLAFLFLRTSIRLRRTRGRKEKLERRNNAMSSQLRQMVVKKKEKSANAPDVQPAPP